MTRCRTLVHYSPRMHREIRLSCVRLAICRHLGPGPRQLHLPPMVLMWCSLLWHMSELHTLPEPRRLLWPELRRPLWLEPRRRLELDDSSLLSWELVGPCCMMG